MSQNNSGTGNAQNKVPKTNGKPIFKMRDGTLTVSVFSMERPKGDPYVFIVPERAYKKGEDWFNTSTLHADDLLSMAFLLMQAHSKLRTKIQTETKE